MTNHKVETQYDQGLYKARCSCRQESRWMVHRWQTDDWTAEHMALIERIKVHMGNRNPSLQNQYDWYCEMALDPKVSDFDRRLWEQLRDELGTRLGVNSAEQWVEDPLPFEVERRTDATHTVRRKDSH